MPIVLVQNPVIVNEGYDWKDIEGERYHFPNQYKNRCTEGTPFVYYRGTRRPDGKRAAPEYFGYGRIGNLWRDDSIPESKPKREWAWYCGITDYIPFSSPSRKNRWKVSRADCAQPLERWRPPTSAGDVRQDSRLRGNA